MKAQFLGILGCEDVVEDWVRTTSETSELDIEVLHLGVAQRYSPELLFIPDSDLRFNHYIPGWLWHGGVLVEER